MLYRMLKARIRAAVKHVISEVVDGSDIGPKGRGNSL